MIIKNKRNIIIYLILLLISLNNIYGQYSYETVNLPVNNLASDGCFINPNIGFLAIENGSAIIIKTTNKGLNWSTLYNFNNNITIDNSATISFINENTGWVSFGKRETSSDHYLVYKTTNGGINWNQVYSVINTENVLKGKIRFVSENVGYFITNFGARIFKTIDGGISWIQKYSHSSSDGRLISIEFSKNNSSTIYIGGMTGTVNDGNLRPILLKSANGFESYTTIFDGIYDPDNHQRLSSVSVVENNGDLVRFISNKGLYKLNTDNTITLINNNLQFSSFLSFSNELNGFVSNYDETYHTTNGGINWSLENTVTSGGIYGTVQFNNIYYAYGYLMNFITRKLGMNLSIYNDNNPVTGTIQFDGENKSVASGGSYYYLRGGTSHLYIDPQFSQTDKVFYKWNDGVFNYDRSNYYFDSPQEMSAYFKTKNNSITPDAISTPSQTKAIRDTNGTINQIHESMGGIFYSRSVNNGNTFSKEEIVNYDGTNNSVDGNFNSFLSEVKSSYINSNAEDNVVAVWQRREGSNEVIKFAYRNTTTPPLYWERNSNCDIYINSANPFNAKPKAFVYSVIPSDPYNYFSLIAYLKPNTNGSVDLIVRGKKSSVTSPFRDMIIATGNITDFSVTRSCQYPYQVLLFAYIKDNNVWYKSFRFDALGSTVDYLEDPSDPPNPISDVDGNQQTRTSPDISLRNGRPVIAYRGYKYNLRRVLINGNTNDWILMSIYDHPIIVRYKYLNNSTEVWSTPTFFGSGGHLQDNPNIEGNKNFPAYVVSYSFDNTQYRQRAYLQTTPGYCNPSQFTGTDAKLVRGSFFGSNQFSSPMLMTLSPNGSLYTVGNQTFSISGTPNPNDNIIDNLVGIIRENNINYSFNLGPIIVKNTNITDPYITETSITNYAEFTNSMISGTFNLGPNDTLILGGNGYYTFDPNAPFTQKNYSVNLIRKSNNEVFRTLFSNSILSTDTIESEYLRGYIFTSQDLQSVDSFYVQLVVEQSTLSGTDQNFTACNVYSPDEVYTGGDNPHTYKKKVFFQNGNNTHSNINNIPKEFALSQNYPNPFNPVTKINYDLPKDSKVKLVIYDLLGREVRTLINDEFKVAGRYNVEFNGSNLASGIYFYRLQAGDFVSVKRMVLVK